MIKFQLNPFMECFISKIFKFNTLLFALLSVFCTTAYPQDSHMTNVIKQIEKIRINNNVSAALVVLVDKNNTIMNRHLGKPQWQSALNFNEDHMFRIGSISKSFAGLLTLRMQQQGLIKLQSPLADYVKDKYIVNQFSGHKISIEQLLEHTAGLADLTKPEWDYNDSKQINIETALSYKLGNHKTLWPPGLHSSYSNVGVAFVGLALEKASGESYEQLMDKYVFKPLAMQSSGLVLNSNIKKRLITGYNSDGESEIPYWHNIYRPFAAINTDADDMIQFLQMLLNNGQHANKPFLSQADLTRMETPKTPLSAQNGLKYGYGLGNYQWQTDGYTFHGHGGDADGYLSRYGYNRESGQAYFIMINAFQHATLAKIQKIMESFITKDLAKPTYPQRLQLNNKRLNQYIGHYAQVTSRFGHFDAAKPVIEIFLKDKNLIVKKQGYPAHTLYALGGQLFRYRDESIATVAFINYKDKIYFQGDSGNFIKLTKLH